MDTQRGDESRPETVTVVWDQRGWRYFYDDDLEQWSREDDIGSWDWDELQEFAGHTYEHPPLKVGDSVDTESKLESLPIGATIMALTNAPLHNWKREEDGWVSNQCQYSPVPSSDLYLTELNYVD
ncbi:hypothetical protein [Flaviflexus massiliensis]|uniref:hypothetical protein n=1 Tax=Flaviflexus massiliensis TaxID=1522309 RepID=UPI0006D554D8|nr:hypothetical protein [Flaviflexus massiliensis]